MVGGTGCWRYIPLVILRRANDRKVELEIYRNYVQHTVIHIPGLGAAGADERLNLSSCYLSI
jgi:hypothetical protein